MKLPSDYARVVCRRLLFPTTDLAPAELYRKAAEEASALVLSDLQKLLALAHANNWSLNQVADHVEKQSQTISLINAS